MRKLKKKRVSEKEQDQESETMDIYDDKELEEIPMLPKASQS